MLNTWARHIFRPDSTDVQLLKSYLADFTSAADLPLAIIPAPAQRHSAIKQQAQKPQLPYQLEGEGDDQKADEKENSYHNDKGPGYPSELPNDNDPYGGDSVLNID